MSDTVSGRGWPRADGALVYPPPEGGASSFRAGLAARAARRARGAAQPNIHRTTMTDRIAAETSASSPAGTAWRVLRTFTAPKYTAIT